MKDSEERLLDIKRNRENQKEAAVIPVEGNHSLIYLNV